MSLSASNNSKVIHFLLQHRSPCTDDVSNHTTDYLKIYVVSCMLLFLIIAGFLFESTDVMHV